MAAVVIYQLWETKRDGYEGSRAASDCVFLPPAPADPILSLPVI
jgi:hypothetical protein